MFFSDIYQILGLLGAIISILIYGALQFNYVKAESISFSFYNLLGSILIAISLIKYFNVGTLLVEIFWISISVYGLFKAIKLNLINKRYNTVCKINDFS